MRGYNEYIPKPYTADREDGAAPGRIYELFLMYATWSNGGRSCGVHAADVKRLLLELELMPGLPRSLQDAYVKQHMLRADQDKDGLLSIGEFMVWFFTEVAALVPTQAYGGPNRNGGPLYNQCVHYMSWGAGDSARRSATALLTMQFRRMVCDCKLVPAPKSRSAARMGIVDVALNKAASDRSLGQVEGGARLQLPQALRALNSIAIALNISIDAALYQIVSFGQKPPILRPGTQLCRAAVLESVVPLYLSGEEPSTRTTYCEDCGTSHKSPVYDDILSKLRTVFHRYNLRLNKGLPPPASSDDDDDDRGHSSDGGSDGEGKTQPGSRGTRGGSGFGAVPGGPAGQGPDKWSSAQAACCCQYRSLSLMEMQTWWRVCSDNTLISNALTQAGSGLTPQRVETAFMLASSIGGMYCSDSSIGFHDKPVTTRAGLRYTPTHNNMGTPPPGQLYGTPYSLASNKSAVQERAVAAPHSEAHVSSSLSTPWAKSVARPQSGPAGLGGSSPRASLSASISSPKGGAGGFAGSAPPGVVPQDLPHRPPVPSLNFIQFVEALRLVAVYMSSSAMEPRHWAQAPKKQESVPWQVALKAIIDNLMEDG